LCRQPEVLEHGQVIHGGAPDLEWAGLEGAGIHGPIIPAQPEARKPNCVQPKSAAPAGRVDPEGKRTEGIPNQRRDAEEESKAFALSLRLSAALRSVCFWLIPLPPIPLPLNLCPSVVKVSMISDSALNRLRSRPAIRCCRPAAAGNARPAVRRLFEWRG